MTTPLRQSSSAAAPPHLSLASNDQAEAESTAEATTRVRLQAPRAPQEQGPARPQARKRKPVDRNAVARVLGLAVHLMKTGPAVRSPVLHRALHGLGVLDRMPESWEDSPRVEGMPWGAEPVTAPEALAPGGLDAAWPQEPVVDERFYAPVLRPDGKDRSEHYRYNVARYMGQVMMLTPKAALKALTGPRLIPIDDETFAQTFSGSSLGQFIDLELSPADRAAFAGDLAAPGSYARLDFSFVAPDHVLPGIWVAPTVTLLRRRGETGYEAVAIRVGDEVFRPSDGDAWALARYFVLQGSQTRMINCHHPRLHFPNDVINAVTRAALPPGHPIYKLIMPHTRFTPGLHEAVIHHRRSVLHNSQREIYSPFAYHPEGIHEEVAVGHHGLPGSTSYRPYRFGEFFLGEHTEYGRYRRDWFNLWLDFTTRVCQLVERDDLYLPAWADHIARWLPDFPRGHEILEGDRLARALATYLCSVTVFHGADHHSYASLPLERMPLRLRVPPPDQKRPGKLDLDALVTAEDFFRHQLGHAMFFAPVVIQSLRDVDHGFRHAHAREAVRRFTAGMDVLDQRWAGTSFPRSSQISCSVQY